MYSVKTPLPNKRHKYTMSVGKSSFPPTHSVFENRVFYFFGKKLLNAFTLTFNQSSPSAANTNQSQYLDSPGNGFNLSQLKAFRHFLGIVEPVTNERP